MGLKVKLVKSFAGAADTQRRTIQGLGLKKLGQERLLKDTPEVRGMIFKVQHLVDQTVVQQEPSPSRRRKPRKIRLRDLANQKAAGDPQTKP